MALYVWAHPSEIKHYTTEELIGLTCEELSEKHEEIIFEYHDAEIARYNRTGAFSDDLGLPKDDVLPYVILMKKYIQDNDLRGFNLSKPFTIPTQRLHYEFFAEITSVCATSPSRDALEAVEKAAKNLNLID